METFAEKLHEVRKERDFTQERLSKEMNVSRQTISHWENGRAVPDIDTIKHLSQVLDFNFLAIEGMTDEAQNAPSEVKESTTETAARETKTVPGKKRILAWAAGIAVLAIVLLCVFVFKGNIPKTDKETGAHNTKEPAAQKANVVITPVMNPVPLIVVEDFPEGYGWMYEVSIEETAGVPFTASALTQTIVGEDGEEYPHSMAAEKIAVAWGGDILYKDAPRNWRGGIPVQPVKAIKVSVCGTDANGNEVEAECTIELLKETAE